MSSKGWTRTKNSNISKEGNTRLGELQQQLDNEEELLFEEQQVQEHLLAAYEDKSSETEKSQYSEIITTSSSSSFTDEKTKSEDLNCKAKPGKKWKQLKVNKNHAKQYTRTRYRAKINKENKPGCDKKSSLDSIEEFYCLYITSVEAHHMVTTQKLEQVLRGVVGQCRLKQASCGIIAIFTDKSDFDKVLQLDMKKVFGVPIQVGNLCNNDRRYRNYVTFKNIPWCISIQELSQALKEQGIHFGKILRMKNFVRVEVFNSCHLERLLQEGLNFYNCKSFAAVAEGFNDNYNSDIIQCYKCQGFWHTANHCRHTARCVRCGENHDVDFCPRPKNNAVCCNCGGPHHAAYKNCPIKLQLMNSAKVAFSLACKPRNPSFSN